MKKLLVASLAISALMALPAMAFAAVTNGSFENGTVPGVFTTLGAVNNTDITGWSVDTGSVDYIGTYWTASEGARSVDMNGNETASISQTLATVVGATYDVSFDLSGNPDSGPSLKVLRVSATGAAPQDFTYDTGAKGNDKSDMKWEGNTYSFVATGISTTLTFASQIAGAFGPVLDNVAISDNLLCEAPASQALVSDTTTTAVGDTTIPVAFIHSEWTASIPGATWIWKTGATASDEVVAFEKSFIVTGTVLSAVLDIASDNSYKVFIDNVEVAADPSEDNFHLGTQDTHNLIANVTPGVHTLRIEVKNWGAFDATSNPAGLLYKFEVQTQVCVVPASVSGYKFFDMNGNGVWNAGEPGLSGWTFNLAGPTAGSQVTGAGGAYSFTNLIAGAYTLSETLQAGWTQTTPNPAFALVAGEDKTNVNIGNSCFVSTGGKSKGFWTNKNGEATMKDGPDGAAPELAMLSALNLRNANGTNFDTASYSTYKTWNTNANATNMAYMLSAQLSAVALSVEATLTNGGAMIVAPELIPYPVSGISALGLISINDLMTAANTELGANGNTTSPHASRAYQEALKNVLDRVANGQNIQVCAL
jgi:choice-of-anchor C domain-containing protein